MQQFAFGSGRNPSIKLIGVNTPFEPRLQLGHEFRSSEQSQPTQRNHTLAHLNSPRTHDSHALTHRAPVRQQTILSHRLSPELQKQLRSGFAMSKNEPKRYPMVDRIEMGRPEANSTLHYPNYPDHQRQLTTMTAPSIAGVTVRAVHHIY